MHTLVVLTRNPFDSEDGGTYAVRASLRQLERFGPVSITGFGEAFDRPFVGSYPACGSLGNATNSKIQFASSLAHRLPFAFLKYAGAHAQGLLRRIVASGSFNVIWYEQSQAAAAAYVSGLLSEAPRSARHMLRSHNLEHQIIGDRIEPLARFFKPLFRLEAAKLRLHEIEMIHRMDRVFTISREDCDTLAAATAEPVNHIQWLPVPMTGRAAPPASPWESRNVILFIGRCSWPPNREAALWIIHQLAPALARTAPQLRIRLVGSRTESLRKVVSSGNVDCIGFAPSLDPEYARAICTIAPVRSGSGINIKVLESLSRGVPVVATPFATRGIDLDVIRVADSVDDFVRQIRSFVVDPATAQRQSTDILARFLHWSNRADAMWNEALLDAGRA